MTPAGATPPGGTLFPGTPVLTWDRWQDGRIRGALALGAVALAVAVAALAVGLSPRPRPLAETARTYVVTVEPPPCPPAPACPACPACPLPEPREHRRR